MAFLTPSIIKLQADGKTAAEFSIASPNNGQLTLSDHSRSELQIKYDVIEKSQRMANGTTRKYVVAKKKQLSCSWDMLPTVQSMVVDGNANAKKMKQYYELYAAQPLTMTLYYGRNASTDATYTEPLNVFWDSFDFDIAKRYNDFDYWNISAEFVEI